MNPDNDPNSKATNSNKTSSTASKNKKLIAKLGLIVVGMFLFAVFVLPPMYDVLCDITGLNGKIELTPASQPNDSDESESNDTVEAKHKPASPARTINVGFTTKVDKDMPWTFNAVSGGVDVVPGKTKLVYFEVFNPTDKDMVSRAIPSISPARAAQYVNKMECFCFEEQPLAAGESKRMPMRFYLDKDTPKEIEQLTLSYTLYNRSSM